MVQVRSGWQKSPGLVAAQTRLGAVRRVRKRLGWTELKLSVGVQISREIRHDYILCVFQ